MKYEKLSKEILLNVGGKENIHGLMHCFTRLRFVIKDMSKVNIVKIKELEEVLGVVDSNGQLQVILGNIVSDVCSSIKELAELDEDGSEHNKIKSNEKLLTKIFNAIAAIFTPIIPGLAGAGVLKGLLILLITYGILDKSSGTYIILNAATDSIFYFMPIILGYTTSKQFKVSPIISMMIGASLLYPDLILSLTGDETLRFLGIPVVSTTYSSTVIPIILTILAYSKLEKFLNKLIPELLRMVLVPALSILILVPVALLVFGPFGNYTSEIIGNIYTAVSTFNPILCGVLLGGGYSILIIFGAHRALVPIGINEVAITGQTVLFAFTGQTNFAQAGAAFGTFLRLKDKKMKSVALTSSLTALFAVTEPAIYGVNLKYKKPMIAAIIGGAIGGGIVGFGGSRAIAVAIPSLLTLPAFIGEGFIWFLIAITVSFVVSAVITVIIGIDEECQETKLKEVKKYESNTIISENTGIEKEKILSPVAGKLVKLDDVEDVTFSSGAMGKGIAMIPSEGKMYSPINGKIAAIFPTGHAIAIQSKKGTELLIHIGIDTVKLEGKYFKALVKQDDEVKVGDLLVEFDMQQIKEEGFDITTPIIVTNSSDFLDVVETSKSEVIKNEEIISVL